MADDINSLKGDDRQRAAYQYFLGKGWSPVQAAGIVGGLKGETPNLNTIASHDNGRGLGIAGWNGDRLTGLIEFASTQGKSPTDLQTQLDYVDHELRTSESGAGNLLSAAQNPQDAGQATLAYFRPSNWNLPGAHPERAQAAGQFYNQFNGPQNGVQAINKALGAQDQGSADNQALGFAAGGNSPRQPATMVAAGEPDFLGSWNGLPASVPEPDFLGSWNHPQSTTAPVAAVPPPAAPHQVQAPPPANETLPQYTNRLEAEHQGDTWADRGVRLGAGLMRGGGDVADTLAQGITALGDKGAGLLQRAGVISPETAQNVSNWRNNVNSTIAANNQGFTQAAGDSTLADVGRVGGQLIATAPVLGPLADMVPGAGIGRVAAQGGLLGAGSTALTSSASNEPLSDQLVQGGLTGAAVGGVGQIASKAGSAVARAVTPQIDQYAAKLAQVARDKFGININALQLSDSNSMLRAVQSMLQKAPLSGFGPAARQQAAQWESSLINEAGGTGTKVTPDVLDDIFKKTSAEYKAQNAALGQLPINQTQINALDRIAANSDERPVVNAVNEIKSKIKSNGMISADDHKYLSSENSYLADARKSSDGEARRKAGQIRDILDDALFKADPNIAAARQATDYKYAVGKALQAASKDSPIGGLSPAKVFSEFKEYPQGQGASSATQLGQIGKQFLREPPSSWTAERALAALGTGATIGIPSAVGIYAMHPEDMNQAMLDAGMIGGGLLLGRGVGRLARSSKLADMLINRNAGSAVANAPNKLSNLLRGGMAPAIALGARSMVPAGP